MEESVVIMGIFIGKHNRSSSWIGRFDPKNPEDMKEYEIVKAVVRVINANSSKKFRVRKERDVNQNMVLFMAVIQKVV